MGEQQDRKAASSEAEQAKGGRVARWRARRRENSARAADISRRASQAGERNVDSASKYWGR